jgi:group II intron reverse transcriptase/maturase
MEGPSPSETPANQPEGKATPETVDYFAFWEQAKRTLFKRRGLTEETGEGDVPPQNEPANQSDWTQGQVRVAEADSEGLQNALGRIRQAARQDRELKFTNLWHHVYSTDRLREAYLGLARQAAPGEDGRTWQDYGKNLEENLRDLSERLIRGTYHARPVMRVYIPKADGRQRPVGMPVLEDKIVQRATVKVLNAIYEEDFLGFSYGFRPGRSCHMAVDALAVGIQSRKVSYILDADIRGFFDSLDHEWLIKFIEHRIADPRVIRHIRKWLNAGVLEKGQYIEQEEGVPQGGSVSPLLANIYLHYVLDLWAEQWKHRQAHGEVIIVRYADDFVVGFQHRSDADAFLAQLRERFRQFKLELHAEKTRVIEFGRFASERRERRHEGKPATFDFLGFTHSCSKTWLGKFIVLRQTMPKRMRAKLKEIKLELGKRTHAGIEATGQWLRSVVRGYMQYHAIPRNLQAVNRFRHWVSRLWRYALSRRSQKGAVRWDRMGRLIERWLPTPRICHPYPEQRLAAMLQGRSPVR